MENIHIYISHDTDTKNFVCKRSKVFLPRRPQFQLTVLCPEQQLMLLLKLKKKKLISLYAHKFTPRPALYMES